MAPQLTQQARTQWVQAVREHWCSGEEGYYGLQFWLFGPVADALETDPTSHPDLFAASHAAAVVASQQGY